MSGAELPLAIVGAVAAVDVAIKTVIETCSALHNAEQEVRERGTRLRSNCLAMKLQLEILRQTRNNFDEEGQKVQDEVLQILASKLDATETKLKSLVKCRSSALSSDAFSAEFTMSKRERTKYATLKDRLDMAINEVESWQRLSFNPLWFITLKSQTQQFDEDLEHARKQNPGKGNSMITEAIAVRDPLQKASSTHVFLPPAKLDAAKIIEIAFSSVKLAQIEDRWRLLDSVSGLSKRTIRDLAVKLKHAKPSTFSLLTCFGAVHDDKKNEACLVFRTPEDMFDPETLRAKMLARNLSHSLSERFRLAMQLARAVCSVHTFGMVHKSIRPENIIVFRDRESILGTAFLLGFERLRREEDQTRLTGDTDRVKNLYRHPQRQGPKLRDPYVMQHDIYSLGVCLLEIGLWSSFVEYTSPTSYPVISQSYKLGVEGLDNTEYSEAIKTKLLALARDNLPEKMGTKYSRVVETCLTCLDEGNEDFSDETEFQDEDGILVAIRYIEKRLTAINLDRILEGLDRMHENGFAHRDLKPASIQWEAVERSDRRHPSQSEAEQQYQDSSTLQSQKRFSVTALQTLKGHEKSIVCLAFSPDGKVLVSAGNEKTIRLWDGRTGTALQTLEGHGSFITFSPDGKVLVSGGYDKTVRLWDGHTGTALQTLKGHETFIKCIAFSPDGKVLGSAGGDKTVRLWDGYTGTALQTLKGHENCIKCVAFSPDGKVLASAGHDKTVRLWTLSY
ncbi:hypothetical protein DL767_003484 [Monosporascus sp. MG133]|nr:hypothetical protein DL767_003484 [Monosporascus sp. MG133]